MANQPPHTWSTLLAEASVKTPQRVPGICRAGHVWEVRMTRVYQAADFRCGYRPRRPIASAPCGRLLVHLEPDEEAAYAIGGLDAVVALVRDKGGW